MSRVELSRKIFGFPVEWENVSRVIYSSLDTLCVSGEIETAACFPKSSCLVLYKGDNMRKTGELNEQQN